MPPRMVKRGAASAVRRGGRGGRGTPKAAQNQQNLDSAQEVVKHEEKQVVEEKPVVVEKPVVEEKHFEERQVGIDMNQMAFDINQVASEAEEANLITNGSAAVRNDEEEVKESIDEYEKDERLDLEDNDPDSRV
ncbi:hypothetical protein K1719_015378 [Acacia pycnantha]|nr:hypothetical protein K1719_015378 [Acacia pycnantha]